MAKPQLRSSVLAWAWPRIPGVAVLSAPDGGPLTRTVKKIIDPLVIRTAARPRLGRPLLDEESAAELTKLLLADAPRLRATAEWFTHLKKQRRALRITAGNVQDVCFPLAYELATGFGTPGPEAAKTAAAALRDLHGEGGATGADELTAYLADPRVAADLTKELHRRWQAATPAARSDNTAAQTGETADPTHHAAESAAGPSEVRTQTGVDLTRGAALAGGVAARAGDAADGAAGPGGVAAQIGGDAELARSPALSGGVAAGAGDIAGRAADSAVGPGEVAAQTGGGADLARNAGWPGGIAAQAGETADRTAESATSSSETAAMSAAEPANPPSVTAAALSRETADQTAESATSPSETAAMSAAERVTPSGGTAEPANPRGGTPAVLRETDVALADSISQLAEFVETLADSAWRALAGAAAGHVVGLALRRPGGSAAVAGAVQGVPGLAASGLGLQRGDHTSVPPLSRRDETGAELLERSVERRVRATLRRTPADERAAVAELVDDELSRVAAGFGLGLPALAGCFALGVVVAPALRPLDGAAPAAVPEFARRLNAQVAREGYVLHARRALAGGTPLTPRPDPELVRELREFAKQFLGRLWIRLHGFDVRGEIPADAADVRDLVTGVVRSTSLDLRTKVRRALVARLPELEAAS
jgi:hypothetical protein